MPTRQQFIDWLEQPTSPGRIVRTARFWSQRLQGRRGDISWEDMAQMALLRALSNIEKHPFEIPDDQIAGWFSMVIRGVVLDRARSSELRTQLTSKGTIEDEPKAEPDVNDLLFAQEALQLLTPREQMVIHLLYFEDLRVAEVARVLNVSFSAVAKTHTRALRKLREFME